MLIYLFIYFIYLLFCLLFFIYLFIYLFIYIFRLTGFKMQRACKLIMLVLIVYSGCENGIDLQTLIL